MTCGAGGNTSAYSRTLQTVDRIQREHQFTAMAHLTCVNRTRDLVADILQEARELGIRNILALRGDPPKGDTEPVAQGSGFDYSYQLVRFIRDRDSFSIGVAGFPEGHTACSEGRETDWERLQQKIDCGADFVITQLFFQNRDYFELRDFLARRGARRQSFLESSPSSAAARSTGSSRRAEPRGRVSLNRRCASTVTTMPPSPSGASTTQQGSATSSCVAARGACISIPSTGRD